MYGCHPQILYDLSSSQNAQAHILLTIHLRGSVVGMSELELQSRTSVGGSGRELTIYFPPPTDFMFFPQQNTSALQAMLKAYNSILASVRGKASFNRGLLHQSQLKGPTEFHLFADLPLELRRLIWTFALPSRIIEASLKYGMSVLFESSFKAYSSTLLTRRSAETSWRCHISGSRLDSLDSRQIYTLFSVNSESRAVCLESYISFCGVYVHRRLDVLYLSWQQSQPGATIQHRSSSLPIEGQPFNQLHTVAITLMRNSEYDDNRFGALVDCLRTFGTPRQLLLCLIGPNLPNLFSDITGFSISSGKNVVLLDWPNKVEEHMGESVIGHVMAALEAEQTTNPDFKIPIVDGRLRYITVSNPSRHVLRDPLPF